MYAIFLIKYKTLKIYIINLIIKYNIFKKYSSTTKLLNQPVEVVSNLTSSWYAVVIITWS